VSDQHNIPPLGPDKKSGQLSEDKLLAYLEGRLSPAEQHEVELWIAEEGMESDALEGLKEMPPEETKHTVNRLNHQLRKSIVSKKRTRRSNKQDNIVWIAVLIILLLTVLAFVVIRKSL
jgi:anti-sigma factor RsiW